MERVIDFFKQENIYDEDFFIYIKSKVHYLPYNADLGWFGCFPILDDHNILIDIRLLVPKIETEKNLLINLHEFFHAYELYHELGNLYIEDREQKEKRAKSFEKKYLQFKNSTG